MDLLSMFLPRKTLALISCLVIVLAALFMLTLSAPEKPSPILVHIEPTPTPIAQTILTLSPNPVELTASSEGTITAEMDTQSNEVIAVQLEIQYDPAVLENVSVKPGTFFTTPVPLLNNVDKKDGRISYALSIAPAQPPLQGKGTVAIISFTKKSTAAPPVTNLDLLPRTIVVARGVGPSVLSQAFGTKVTLTTP